MPRSTCPSESLNYALHWEGVRADWLARHGRHREAEQAQRWAEHYRDRIAGLEQEEGNG